MEKENKTCKKCGSQDFVPNGKYTRCNPCHVKQRSSRYKSRKDEFDIMNNKWVQENKEKSRDIKNKWRSENKEKQTAASKAWKADNKGRVREYCANRRASLKNATPRWADREEMKYIHKLAAERNLVVDHIVPLNSNFVCGLNTPDNLRCITKELNAYKGNRYWPDMTRKGKRK